MGISRKYLKALGVIALSLAIVAIYQNCGIVQGTGFNIVLGNGTGGTLNPANAVMVQGKIAAGFYHTCGINSGGGVQCWGWGQTGQLGFGSTVQYTQSAVNVINLPSTAVKVSSGPYFTCALLTSGAVYCWGDNTNGQLGNNTSAAQGTPYSATPVLAAVESSQVYDIATSYYTTCAVLGTGVVQCWGSNGNGELGVGSGIQSSLTPVSVNGITDAVRITAGYGHFCATHITGTMSCWGLGASGQLGNQVATTAYTPVTVTGLMGSSVKAAAFYYNTCAIVTGGAVQCWGDDTYGQLGNDSTTPTLALTSVYNMNGATDIAVGAYSACALFGSSVQCWGNGGEGEIGNSLTNNYDYPQSVTGLSNASAIGAGAYHVCAALSGGGFQCWGSNEYGQIGVGSTGTLGNYLTPTTVANVN